ncbi:MAG: DUF4279 domain-containing protein [Leptolyngbyaceae cyanobacterium]
MAKKINVSLRLRGDLPSLEFINNELGVEATTYYKKGELTGRKKNRVQSQDIWILNLTSNLDYESSIEEEEHSLLNAVTYLDEISPRLSSSKLGKVDSDIYISCIQEEDQGGFCLPFQLIQVIASMNLPIRVSTLFI